MTEVGQLVLALFFPFGCLLMLLWLSRLEDNLNRDVRRRARQADPAPILRVPARTPLVPDQASVVSRSAAASFGGSTKR